MMYVFRIELKSYFRRMGMAHYLGDQIKDEFIYSSNYAHSLKAKHFSSYYF